jgi:hypothetical protein
MLRQKICEDSLCPIIKRHYQTDTICFGFLYSLAIRKKREKISEKERFIKSLNDSLAKIYQKWQFKKVFVCRLKGYFQPST